MSLAIRRVCAAAFFFTVLPAVSSAVELGRAEGHMSVGGVQTPVKYAYGRWDTRGASPQLVIVIRPDASKDIERGARLELRLDERYRPLQVIVWDGTPKTVGGSLVSFRSDIASRRLIQGTVTFSGDQPFGVVFRTTIGDTVFAPNAAATAELESAPPIAPAPFPADAVLSTSDGGEPVRAYRAYEAAFRTGRIAAIKKTMTGESAAGLDQTAEFLPLAIAIHPVKIQVVSTSIDGNTATLKLKGTPVAEGGGSSGTATIVKQDGVWKLGGEHWEAAGPNERPAFTQTKEQTQAALPLTKGSPLPADGGEPGKVWRAYDAAFAKSDLTSMKKLMMEANAKQLDQFAEALEGFKALRPANAKVTGGITDGAKATLQLEGFLPWEEKTGNGKVTLVKEGGQWKVVGEDWAQPVK